MRLGINKEKASTAKKTSSTQGRLSARKKKKTATTTSKRRVVTIPRFQKRTGLGQLLTDKLLNDRPSVAKAAGREVKTMSPPGSGRAGDLSARHQRLRMAHFASRQAERETSSSRHVRGKGGVSNRPLTAGSGQGHQDLGHKQKMPFATSANNVLVRNTMPDDPENFDFADEKAGLNFTMIPPKYHRRQKAEDGSDDGYYPTQLYPPRGPPGAGVRDLVIELGYTVNKMLHDLHHAYERTGDRSSSQSRQWWLPPPSPDVQDLKKVLDVHNYFGGDCVGLNVKIASYRSYHALYSRQEKIMLIDCERNMPPASRYDGGGNDGDGGEGDADAGTTQLYIPKSYFRRIGNFITGGYVYEFNPERKEEGGGKIPSNTSDGAKQRRKGKDTVGEATITTANTTRDGAECTGDENAKKRASTTDTEAADVSHSSDVGASNPSQRDDLIEMYSERIVKLLEGHSASKLVAEHGIYTRALHELARQVRQVCCEQGELIHTLTHRSSSLLKALYAATKRECREEWALERQQFRTAIAALLHELDKRTRNFEQTREEVRSRLKVAYNQLDKAKKAETDCKVAVANLEKEAKAHRETKKILAEFRVQNESLRSQLEDKDGMMSNLESLELSMENKLNEEKRENKRLRKQMEELKKMMKAKELESRQRIAKFQFKLATADKKVEAAQKRVKAAETQVTEMKMAYGEGLAGVGMVGEDDEGKERVGNMDSSAGDYNDGAPSGAPELSGSNSRFPRSKVDLASTRNNMLPSQGANASLSESAHGFLRHIDRTRSEIYLTLYDPRKYDKNWRKTALHQDMVARNGVASSLSAFEKKLPKSIAADNKAKAQMLQLRDSGLEAPLRKEKWIENMIWKSFLLKRKQDSVDAFHRVPRMEMSDFFLFIILFADGRGSGSNPPPSSYSSFADQFTEYDRIGNGGSAKMPTCNAAEMRVLAWNLLHSLYVYAGRGNVLAEIFLNFLEGWFKLDTLNFVLDLIRITATCHVGITFPSGDNATGDYPGDQDNGSTPYWVCYLRCRWVVSNMMQRFGPAAIKSLNSKIKEASEIADDEVLRMRRRARRMLLEDPLGENYLGMETEKKYEEAMERKARAKQIELENLRKGEGEKNKKIVKKKKKAVMHRKVRFDLFIKFAITEYCKQSKAYFDSICQSPELGGSGNDSSSSKGAKGKASGDSVDGVPYKALATVIGKTIPEFANFAYLRRLYYNTIKKSSEPSSGLSQEGTVMAISKLLSNGGCMLSVENPCGHQANVSTARISEHLGAKFLALVHGSWKDLAPIYDKVVGALKSKELKEDKMLEFTMGNQVLVQMLEQRKARLNSLLERTTEQLNVTEINACYSELLADLERFFDYRENQKRIKLGNHTVARLQFTDGQFPELAKQMTVATSIARVKMIKFMDSVKEMIN